MPTVTWSAADSPIITNVTVQMSDRFFVHKYGGGLGHYASGIATQVYDEGEDIATKEWDPTVYLYKTLCGAFRDIGMVIICRNESHDHATMCQRCLKIAESASKDK